MDEDRYFTPKVGGGKLDAKELWEISKRKGGLLEIEEPRSKKRTESRATVETNGEEGIFERKDKIKISPIENLLKKSNDEGEEKDEEEEEENEKMNVNIMFNMILRSNKELKTRMEERDMEREKKWEERRENWKKQEKEREEKREMERKEWENAWTAKYNNEKEGMEMRLEKLEDDMKKVKEMSELKRRSAKK